MAKKKGAEGRYHMSSDNHMVEAPHNAVGKAKLEVIRKKDRRFKGRRIQSVLQAYPSQIRYYQVYRLT